MTISDENFANKTEQNKLPVLDAWVFITQILAHLPVLADTRDVALNFIMKLGKAMRGMSCADAPNLDHVFLVLGKLVAPFTKLQGEDLDMLGEGVVLHGYTVGPDGIKTHAPFLDDKNTSLRAMWVETPTIAI